MTGGKLFDAAAWQEEAERLIASLPTDQARTTMRREIDRATRQIITGETPADQVKMHWAKEALQPLPPVDYRIGNAEKPLLVNESLATVAGPGGIGKTLAMLTLCVSIAAHKADWLGFELKPGRILWVDEESALIRMLKRLAEVMRGLSVTDDIPFAFLTMIGLQLLEPSGPLILEAAIEASRPDIVCIDSWIDVIAGADDSNATDIQPAFHALRILAAKHHCSFLIIDHTNRSGNYRGSSAKQAAVDLLLIADRKSGGDTIEFNVEKARDIEKTKFAGVMNFAPGVFTLTSGTPIERGETYTKGESYVIRYLQSHNGQAALADIASHADTVSDKTAQNAARSLVGKGITERVDAGGRGDAAVYALTAKGRLASV